MKKTRRSTVILLLLTLLCSIFVFTSCDGNAHTHNYSTEWAKDGTYHWQACSGCEEVRNKAEHGWNHGVITLQPTETSEGARTYTCNTCGQTRIESISALDTHKHTFSDTWSSNETHHWYAAACEHTDEKKDYSEHNWNEGEITTPPTEFDEGVKTFTCTECEKTKTEAVPKLEEIHTHEFSKQNTSAAYRKSAATCTDKAIYYYSCVCGEKGTETFENGSVLGHSYSTAWTCDATHHWHSAMCEHTTETKDKAEHSWNEGEITTPPTESDEGVKTFTCTECEKTKTEAVPKLEEIHTHEFSKQNTSATYRKSVATCTEKAIYYYSCVCGEKGVETFENGSELGHSFIDYFYDNNATCVKDGTKTATCERCAEQDTVTATDTKTGHDFVNYTSNHDATCTEDGTKTAKCERCIETNTIGDAGSAKGHSFSDEWTSDNTHHWHSSTCGHTNEASAKETHHWNAGVVTKQPTETTEGEKTYTCDVCQKTKVDSIGKLDHVHTFDTKYTFDDNYHWYAATCVHTSEVKGKTGHSWDAGVVTKPATTEETGVKTKTCTVCQHQKNEEIPIIATYTVTFYGLNNIVLKTEKVLPGSNAIAPTVPEQDGYRIDENDAWSQSFSDVNANLSIYAKYIQIFTVTFVDYDNRVIDIQIVDKLKDAIAPETPERTGYRFDSWDKGFKDVTSNLIIKAQYVKQHTVIFLGYDGMIIKTELVDDGSFATAPSIPTVEGYKYDVNDAWDKPFDSVTSNLVVSVKYQKNTYAVTFILPNGEKETKMVEHGFDAVPPNLPDYYFDWTKMEAFSFTEWSADISKITSSKEIRAIYTTPYNEPVIAIQYGQNLTGYVATLSLYIPKGYNLCAINFSIDYSTARGSMAIRQAVVNDSVDDIYEVDENGNNANQLVINNKTKVFTFAWADAEGTNFNNAYKALILTFDIGQSDASIVVNENSFKISECKMVIARNDVDDGNNLVSIVPSVEYK